MERTEQLVAGVLALVGAAAGAMGQSSGPTLLTEPLRRAEVLRVAPAVLVDGEVFRTGEWVDPPSGTARAERKRIFDCFGDFDSDGEIDDFGACGVHGRWLLGTSYVNNFVTNDMTLHPGTILEAGADRAQTALYWAQSGECVLGLFTQAFDADACEPDTGGAGWVFDLGFMEWHGYYADLDISGIGTWELPLSGRGSYFITYLTDDGNSWAGNAQPLLWGASNSEGADPAGPGEQGPMQLDDILPPQGEHTVPDECLDYAFAQCEICPRPLGAMLQLWGQRRGGREKEWPVADGGNGHWYEIVFNPLAADWTTAAQRSLERAGHLATVTTEEEGAFLYPLIAAYCAYGGWRPFLGGYQDPDAPEPGGGWYWVTEESFTYQFWDCWDCQEGRCQPDDTSGFDDYLHFEWCPDRRTEFLMGDGPNDHGPPDAYVVEWDADCNGDGLVDFGQIIRGELVDSNTNGVPDGCECIADFNEDGVVNTLDVLAFLNAWARGEARADLNGDGRVNTQDVLAFLNRWSAGC